MAKSPTKPAPNAFGTLEAGRILKPVYDRSSAAYIRDLSALAVRRGLIPLALSKCGNYSDLDEDLEAARDRSLARTCPSPTRSPKPTLAYLCDAVVMATATSTKRPQQRANDLETKIKILTDVKQGVPRQEIMKKYGVKRRATMSRTKLKYLKPWQVHREEEKT
ncbi:hypothetical protein HPB47_013016 [Ixodes persulcatus]|uniref:Uncharacterized protein n=1 Tax=Ixodes persulcatus TaxID=34615 RepID=A0AC60NRZ1_IXOPE|nr:hypothetical protein HPB47_013016 [Ixodes persulcatus]